MRRRQEAPDEAPARLRAFSPDDWKGATAWDSFSAWRDARRTWSDINPDSLGDPVERLAAERAARRAHFLPALTPEA